MKKIFLIATLIFAVGQIFAHGDLDERIKQLTKQIKAEPRNANLYLKRGELFYFHEEYLKAERDFAQAEMLDSSKDVVNYLRGRMYLDWNRPHSAVKFLSKFIEKYPNHAPALHIRARAFVKRNLFEKAAADFQKSIEFSTEPAPEIYLEQAQAIQKNGGKPAQIEKALHNLEDGIKRLGDVFSLHEAAINLEIKLKKFDAAIARIDRLTAKLPRKEQMFFRRAEIEIAAGKFCDARLSFQKTVEFINQIPPERRNTPAIKKLKTDTQTKLKNPAFSACRQ